MKNPFSLYIESLKRRDFWTKIVSMFLIGVFMVWFLLAPNIIIVSGFMIILIFMGLAA